MTKDYTFSGIPVVNGVGGRASGVAAAGGTGIPHFALTNEQEITDLKYKMSRLEAKLEALIKKLEEADNLEQ